jgi:hypothetical protein
LESQASHGASRIAGVLLLAFYLIAVPLALLDLGLRARTKTTVFLEVRNAWRQAAASHLGHAISPVLKALRQLTDTASALFASLVAIGLLSVLAPVLIAIVGLFLYWLSGLLGTAPWWAIVIIVLLLRR